MDDKLKSKNTCSSCGAWNWKVPRCEVIRVLDEFGHVTYTMQSQAHYRCRYCKYSWTERWEASEYDI